MISEYYFTLLITNSFLLNFCQNLRSKNNPNGRKILTCEFPSNIKILKKPAKSY